MDKLEYLHKISMHNRQRLAKAERAGCFYCKKIYVPSEINFWIDDETTAMCPRCGIDSVLAETDGVVITPELLAKMHNRYF